MTYSKLSKLSVDKSSTPSGNQFTLNVPELSYRPDHCIINQPAIEGINADRTVTSQWVRFDDDRWIEVGITVGLHLQNSLDDIPETWA